MKTFQQRLQRCVDRGNLTVADLQRWFGRPYATVRSWLIDGWEPAGGPRTIERVQKRLKELEATIGQHGRQLQDLPMGERARRLEELRC